MKVEIVTPYQHIVNEETEELYAPGPKGEFGVLPGHAHFLTALATGPLYFRSHGKKHSFVLDGGFLEVFQENIFVLADHVERAEHIQLDQAKEELAKIENQLVGENLEPEEFDAKLKLRDREALRVKLALEKASS